MSAPGTLKLQVQWPANRAKLIELEKLRDRFRLALNGDAQQQPEEQGDDSDALIGRIIYGHQFTILREDESKILAAIVDISKELGAKSPIRLFSWFIQEIPTTLISPLTLNTVIDGVVTQKIVANPIQQPDVYKKDAYWVFKKKESTAGKVTAGTASGKGNKKSSWFNDTASFGQLKRKSQDHEILGLTNEATWEEIRKAYRKLAFDSHPDRNADDPSALEKFMKVDGAYKRLKTLYGESVVQTMIDKTINEVIDIEKGPIV